MGLETIEKLKAWIRNLAAAAASDQMAMRDFRFGRRQWWEEHYSGKFAPTKTAFDCLAEELATPGLTLIDASLTLPIPRGKADNKIDVCLSSQEKMRIKQIVGTGSLSRYVRALIIREIEVTNAYLETVEPHFAAQKGWTNALRANDN